MCGKFLEKFRNSSGIVSESLDFEGEPKFGEYPVFFRNRSGILKTLLKNLPDFFQKRKFQNFSGIWGKIVAVRIRFSFYPPFFFKKKNKEEEREALRINRIVVFVFIFGGVIW